jgi:hypothetical protein
LCGVTGAAGQDTDPLCRAPSSRFISSTSCAQFMDNPTLEPNAQQSSNGEVVEATTAPGVRYWREWVDARLKG